MIPVTFLDLGIYLGTTVDPDRGQMMVDKATSLCLSVVSPLPDGAEAVILDVAARGYENPTNVTQEHIGGYGYSAPGGLWLTRANKADLRRLGGGGGAFTIDTLPANAGKNLPWWDTGALIGDFDTPPL